MEFLFADYTQKTEALVTGIRLQNEALTFMNCSCWDWTRMILAAIPTVEQRQYRIQNCKNCCM